MACAYSLGLYWLYKGEPPIEIAAGSYSVDHPFPFQHGLPGLSGADRDLPGPVHECRMGCWRFWMQRGTPFHPICYPCEEYEPPFI